MATDRPTKKHPGSFGAGYYYVMVKRPLVRIRYLATQHPPINIPSARERQKTRLGIETEHLHSHRSAGVRRRYETCQSSILRSHFPRCTLTSRSVLCERTKDAGEREREKERSTPTTETHLLIMILPYQPRRRQRHKRRRRLNENNFAFHELLQKRDFWQQTLFSR